MKEKIFELLKELLLLQSAGGGEMFDNSIKMVIEIYCELTNKDVNKFKTELAAIAQFVWSKYNASNFAILQQNYEVLINNLE